MSANVAVHTPAAEPIPVLMMARELGGGGGIERDVSKFARYLPKYGIAPHVACFNPGGTRWREIEAAGTPVLTVPFKSFRSTSLISGFRVLKGYAAEHQIQVLHTFDLSSNIFGVSLARLFGIPVALSSHLWQRQALSPRMQTLLGLLDGVATGLFTNCHAVAADLACEWKVPRRRIHVCHNGFEPNEFHANGRYRPAKLSEASVVIGTVAVLREEKNLRLLIDAFARGVWPADRQARLLIVGDGPMKPALQEQARTLGIADACIFEPATPNPADWMRAIDVYVLPSSSEAFSNALLEAMACGCCPVGSRVGGTPELIEHGQRGLLFEPGDVQELARSLRGLVLDPMRRRQMADAGTRFAHENLTIDIAAERLAAIYRNLLEQVGHANLEMLPAVDEQYSVVRQG